MEKLVILLAFVGCTMAVNESEHIDLPKCGSEEMVHKGEFSPYDYSAVGFMLFVSLGIGKYDPMFALSKLTLPTLVVFYITRKPTIEYPHIFRRVMPIFILLNPK